MPYLEPGYPLSRFLGFAKATKRFEPVLRFLANVCYTTLYYIPTTLVKEANFSIEETSQIKKHNQESSSLGRFPSKIGTFWIKQRWLKKAS